MVIFLNGRFLPFNKAKVSVFDHGFLYGDGVYETLRTYNGKIWQMDAHLRRLKQSASLLGLKIPWSLDCVGKWVKKTVLLNKFRESRVRITLTRGINNFDFLSCKKPTLCIQVKNLKLEPKDIYKQGVRVITIQKERIAPEAKSISLLPMILGQRLAQKQKAHEAVFVDAKGFVREGTVTNIFIVKNGAVITPKTKILQGVTADLLMQIVKKTSIDQNLAKDDNALAAKPLPYAQKKDFKISYLLQADEVFITNAARGIVPVVKVDKYIIGVGLPGKITKKLLKAFNAYVEEANKK